MSGPAHTVRASLIDRERTYSLGPEALHWREARRQGRIPYDDIRDVRLIGYASAGGEHLQCTLRGRKGGKIKLRSHHYRSLGRFEDRSATYTPFIRELTRRIASRSPDTSFVAGSTALWFVWLVVAILCALVFVALVMALLDAAPLPGAAIAAIVIGLVAVPIVWRRIRQGTANAFDPADPPAELIGNPKP